MNQPHHHMNQQQQGNNVYYSLPRGRGRLHRDYEHPIGGYSLSRPPTPPPFSSVSKSSENLSQYGSRPQTPVNVQRVDENYNRNQYGGGNYHEKPLHKVEDASHKIGGEEMGAREADRESEAGKSDSKARTPRAEFRESLEAQLSPVSPPTPEDKSVKALVADSTTTTLVSKFVENSCV